MTSPLYPPLDNVAPLRVGVMLDGYVVTAWVAHVLRTIEAEGSGRIELVVFNAEKHGRLPLLQRIRNRLRTFLYDRYYTFDAAYWASPESPFNACDLSAMLKDRPALKVTPTRKRFVHRFLRKDVAAIKAAKLDVLLRFGFNIIRGDILDTARYGVWSYHHDDSDEYRGGPSLFWEIYEGSSVSGTVLQSLSDVLDGGDVITRSHSTTNQLSLALNRGETYWKTANFVPRCMRRLAQHGIDALPREKPKSYAKRIYRTPGNLHMAIFLAKVFVRRARNAVRNRRFDEHWLLGYRYADTLLDPDAPVLTNVIPLEPPRGHFWADPAVISRDGLDHVFFEDYSYATGRGTIGHIELTPSGVASDAVTVLELDVHLSYPHMFEWRGDTYMLPETAQARKLTLFRAAEFPLRWEPVCDLLEGWRIVDATLHEHEGRWYLFANIAEGACSTLDELFLFHADSPLGPWLPHPSNPIVSDVRRARPAGPLFLHDRRLIRPAQDCAIRYGRAVQFHEIIELSPTQYRERTLGMLEPDWQSDLIGCHTYVRSGRLEVVDGKRYARRAQVRERQS